MTQYWIWVYDRPGDRRHGKYAYLGNYRAGYLPGSGVLLTDNLYKATLCSKHHMNVTKSMLPTKYYRKQLVNLTLELS